MRLSSGGLPNQPEEGEKKVLNSELWHACAGPLVSLPTLGSRVVYFPQGHSEQVAASTNKEIDAHIPNYPNLPAQHICQLHDVTMHADVETDEVYAQMTLQPLTAQEQKDVCLIPAELGTPSKQPTNYFCKTLTARDTSTRGGFSVPRRAAEKVFPPLDYTQQPPAQELIAKDLHDNEWKFRHVFRGQPKRHLLTTGWSVFVSAKRLVTGDCVIFIWNEKNQLLLGIRRATRLQTVMPSSVLSSDSMHIGLLAAAATNSRFTIFFNPRASPSEFIVPLAKYVKAVAVYHTRVSVGMRFRMLFESASEETHVRRYMGTITGISDLDPVRWPNSHWRSVKVGWDESTAGERQPRVSWWEIELLTTFPMYPSPFPLGLKRPWPSGQPSIPVILPGNISDIRCDIPELRGDNYKVWKETVLLHLGLMDIDYAIRKDEPASNETSTPDAINLYDKWEKSNRLSVMFIKTKICASIRGSLEHHTKVKNLLKAIDEQFGISDKALASTLIMQFLSMRHTETKEVRVYIMRMRDIAAQLKTLEVTISDVFLVHFILCTLPPQYAPFKISYNTHKDKWSINELMIMCVQEEGRLLMEEAKKVNLTTASSSKKKNDH